MMVSASKWFAIHVCTWHGGEPSFDWKTKIGGRKLVLVLPGNLSTASAIHDVVGGAVKVAFAQVVDGCQNP